MSANNFTSTSETDWERLRTITDEDIDTSENPVLGPEFFGTAELRQPEGTVSVLLSIDQELAEWFRSQEGDFRVNIANALRQYADTHR